MAHKVWSFSAGIFQIEGIDLNEFGTKGQIKIEAVTPDKITTTTLPQGHHHLTVHASRGLLVTMTFAQMSDSLAMLLAKCEKFFRDAESGQNTAYIRLYMNVPATETIGEAVMLVPLNVPEYSIGEEPEDVELKFIAPEGRQQLRNYGINILSNNGAYALPRIGGVI